MPPELRFSVSVRPGVDPGTTLLVGLSSPGMAGLTAVDYLRRQLETTPLGHLTPRGLPVATPVEDGTPRAAMRLYVVPDADLTVFVGEQFVPAWAAGALADALLESPVGRQLEEVVVLNGVQYPHEPEDHRVFAVAADEYRERHLTDANVDPLEGGVLGGFPGEILHRSLAGDAPATGVFVTPVHPPALDIDAALYLLDAIESVYGVSLDLTELEDLSDRLQKHYATLSERMATLEGGEESGDSFAVDRMYM